MLVRVHPEHFLRHQFEAEKELGAIRQQQLHIAPAEFHGEVGVFEIGVRVSPWLDDEVEVETGILNRLPQKLLDAGTCLLQGKSAAHAVFRPFGLGFLAGAAVGSGGAVLLKNHCCAILTRLLVK